jgi:AcrR family transcriptional regulator
LERQKRYDEKLVRILDGACRVFAEKGYHDASIRDVATETGVSPAGLYYYFKSKEELLFLILEARLTSLMERLQEDALSIQDPAERLKRIVACHMAHVHRYREGMTVLVREWQTLSGTFGKDIRRLMREYVEELIQTLKEISPRRSRKELRAAAFGLFGMLNWVDQWHRPDRDLPLDVLADRFSEILLRGVAADTSPPLPAKDSQEAATASDWSKKSTKSSILSGPGF